MVNFADRIGFWIHNKINYKLRYILSCHLDIKFARKLSPVTKYIESIITDSTTQEYQINFLHKHEISPSQKLNITLKYVSN